jgi:hypothetical protein
MKLTTSKDKSSLMFPTPVGKAYQCAEETTVQLEGSKDISASVLLRDLKLQPFIFKNDEFGPGKLILINFLQSDNFTMKMF